MKLWLKTIIIGGILLAGARYAAAADIYEAPVYGSQVLRQLQFADIRGHWAAAPIKRMAALGMINGDGSGFFRPDAAVTREEAVAMLVRLRGLESDVESFRADLVSNPPQSPVQWYLPYLDAAQKAKLITGADYQSISANPGQPATREQAAVWLAMTIGLTQTSDTSAKKILAFSDWNQVAPENIGYLETLLQKGLMAGVAGDRFGVRDNLTKAQMAALLDRSVPLTAAQRNEKIIGGVTAAKSSLQQPEPTGITTVTDIQLLTDSGGMVLLRSAGGSQGKKLRDFPVLRGDLVQDSGSLQPGERLQVIIDSSGQIRYAEVKQAAAGKFGGMIAAIDGDRLIIDSGEKKQFQVSPGAVLTNGTRAIRLSDLMPGQMVEAEESGGFLTALHVPETPDYLAGYSTKAAEVITGVVSDVREETLRLRREEGITDYKLNDSTLITRNGRQIKPSLIRPGDRARLTLAAGQPVKLELDRDAYRISGIIKGKIAEVNARGNVLLLAAPNQFVFGSWEGRGSLQKIDFSPEAIVYSEGMEVTLADLASSAIGREIYLAMSAPYGKEMAVKGIVKKQQEMTFNAPVQYYFPGTGLLQPQGSNPQIILSPGSIVVQDGRLVWPEELTKDGQAFIISQVAGGSGFAPEALVVDSIAFDRHGLQLFRGTLAQIDKYGPEFAAYSILKNNNWSDRKTANKSNEISREAYVLDNGSKESAADFLQSRFENLYGRKYFYALADDQKVDALSLWPDDEVFATTTSLGVIRRLDYQNSLLELGQVRDWSEARSSWLESDYLESRDITWQLDFAKALVVKEGEIAGPEALQQGQMLYLIHDQKKAFVIYVQ